MQDDQSFFQTRASRSCGTGLGMVALASLCASDNPVSQLLDNRPARSQTASLPSARPSMLHLFMNGPSHVDTFDPKPALDKYHGQPLKVGNLRTERKTGAAMRSPFRVALRQVRHRSESELFARTAHISTAYGHHPLDAGGVPIEPNLMLANCGDGRCHVPVWGRG